MSYIPEWATHYKITSTEGLGPREYLEIEFFENYSWQHGHSILGMHPIADLAKDLAIADVCQQIKDKPLSERIAEAVRPTEKVRSKYHREIKPGVYVDVYDVLNAFGVKCHALAHAIKKLLMPGERGAKGYKQDCQEAIQSINRSIDEHV